MKQKALAVSLSQKVRDGEVAIIDALTLELPKTKIVAQAIGSIIKGAFGSDVKRPSVTLTTADRNPLLLRAARNLSSTNVRSARELNIFDVLSKRYLIVSKDAVPILVTRVSNRRRTKDDA
jgi:large subunit ribosomal protein L4